MVSRQKVNRPRAKSEGERTRHPTEVRRRLVIESARDLIADKGMFNVQVRDISEACGVSPGTITYHFRSLEEVLWEVVRAETTDFYEPLREGIGEAGERAVSSREALLTLLRGLFKDDADTRRHWLIWIDFWSAAARDDSYGEWMSAHYDGWREAMRLIIERGVERGEFSCADPHAVASDIAALVDGLAVQCFSRKSSTTVGAAAEQLTRFATDRLGPVETAREIESLDAAGAI